ncbi:hypothetical protein [Agromyces silvae]|uniref:hypothetical protein n=1 Tax=Agromyces silvae TaxID=3388266 RepID=UPI00280AEE86|nr:hypothetical protein [Agromyces protaetiae]
MIRFARRRAATATAGASARPAHLAQELQTHPRRVAAGHAAKPSILPEHAPIHGTRALAYGVSPEASAHRRSRRRAPAALALIAAFAVTLGALGGAVAPAHAVGAGTVTVTVAGDPSKVGVADTAAPTTLVVSGSGFQSIQGGFGGVYVLFGWNAGPGWEPSAGGSTGVTYRYVADDPNAPAGYQLFVPFPGSSTEAEGNGGSVNPDGTWSAELTIAGPVFTPVDAVDTGETIDCTQVQCGIMTIGAHGVVNPSNESFTPIAFEDFSAPTPTPEPEPAADAEPTEEPTATADAETTAAEGGDATPWIIAGAVAVVLIGGGAIAIVLMRRRRAAAAAQAAGSSGTAPAPPTERE